MLKKVHKMKVRIVIDPCHHILTKLNSTIEIRLRLIHVQA